MDIKIKASIQASNKLDISNTCKTIYISKVYEEINPNDYALNSILINIENNDVEGIYIIVKIPDSNTNSLIPLYKKGE